MTLVRWIDFVGKLIARMTVMEQVDIYKQVKWLLNNDEFSFSSVALAAKCWLLKIRSRRIDSANFIWLQPYFICGELHVSDST